MQNITNIIDSLQAISFFHNTLWWFFIAWWIVLISALCLSLFRTTLLHKLENLVKKTKNIFDDIIIKHIQEIPHITYWMISFYLWSLVLILPSRLDKTLYAFFIILVVSQLGIISIRIIISLISHYYFKGSSGKNNIHFIKIILNIIIRSLLVLLILNNLWIAITPLLTSLWVVGVAVAFALQNILEDLFSSISIYLDKPFQIGDFIELDTVSGTVTKIGVKTTRITTIRGEEVVVANRKLTNDTIRNYGVMQHRSLIKKFQVEYETDPELLAKIPEYVAEVFADLSDETVVVTLDRVHFTNLDDSWLEFTYKYTLSMRDYDIYLNKDHQVNLKLLQVLKNHGINFAYPTQKIFISK